MTLRVTVSLVISDSVLITTRSTKLTLYLLFSTLLGAVFGIIEAGGSLLVVYESFSGAVIKKLSKKHILSNLEQKNLKIQTMFNSRLCQSKDSNVSDNSLMTDIKILKNDNFYTSSIYDTIFDKKKFQF